MFRSHSLARTVRSTVNQFRRQTPCRNLSFIHRPTTRFSIPSPICKSIKASCSATAHFSSGSKSCLPSGTVDQELVAKIESEINMERELDEAEQMPATVKEFLDTSQFTLNDRQGQEEVELVRKFGNETVRILFSVADFEAMDDKLEESVYDEDDPQHDADEPGVDNGKMSRQRASASPASPQNEEIDEENQDYEEETEPAFPVRVNVTIEKPDHGALQIETVAQDGMIVIENVHYHASVQLATAQTAEADYERRGRYVGPPFGNLDEELQMFFERYLDERGVNTALALFVPDYIDYKEQKEYLKWLENVKTFIAEN